MFIRKVYYLTRLMRSQWYNKKELENLQTKKLRKLINYSYNNIKLYKKKMDQSRISPMDIKSLKDLQKIPFSTKNELKTFSKNDTSNGLDRCSLIEKTTSGSTGEPFTVLFNKKYWDYSQAFLARALFSGGVKLRDRIAFFWYEHSQKEGFYQSLGILKKKEILYTSPEEQQLDELKSFKPSIICGLPTVLKVLADTIERQKLDTIKPRVIFTFGELLTGPLRERLETVFDAEVFNEYASTEFNWMAFECEQHEGFHINAENLLFESVTRGGVKNKLLITDLNNLVMPFIRYETGDVGILSDEPCSCGRGLPLLKRLEGRQDDFLIMPGGRIISPRMIGGSFESIKGVSNYRLIQPNKNSLSVVLEDNPFIDDFKKEEIREMLTKTLKEDIRIIINKVKKIPVNRGKIKVIKSYVKNSGA